MDRVARDLTDETDDAAQHGIRAPREGETANAVSRGDGARSAVETVVRIDPTGVQQGRHGAAAGGIGTDAADLLPAAVVQSVGSGRGRSVVRLAGDAAVCGDRSGARTGTRRDHHLALPPFAREPCFGPATF